MNTQHFFAPFRTEIKICKRALNVFKNEYLVHRLINCMHFHNLQNTQHLYILYPMYINYASVFE